MVHLKRKVIDMKYVEIYFNDNSTIQVSPVSERCGVIYSVASTLLHTTHYFGCPCSNFYIHPNIQYMSDGLKDTMFFNFQ